MRGMSGSVRYCFFHKFAFVRFVDKIALFVDKDAWNFMEA